MPKINFRIIRTFFFLSITILISCNKKNDSCSDNKYYLTFIGNGQRICCSKCIAYLKDNSNHDEYSILQSDYITFLSAGETYTRNDSIWFKSLIAICFPGKTVGVYNNDSIKGLDYNVYLKTDKWEYTFPLYDLNGYRSYFKLSVKEYDLEKKLISGTFNGLLYHYNQNDSLLISDGEFRGELGLNEK